MLSVRSVSALAVGIVILAGTTPQGQEREAMRFEGQRLSDALEALESRGLRMIYSTEIVRSGMRVRSEPRATSLRQVLNELLAPHGLIARDGPGGSVLIVRDPRARMKRVATSQKTQPARPSSAPNPAAGDDIELSRFEETVTITEFDPGVAVAGPPPLALRPPDVRVFAGGLENIFRMLQALPGVAGTEELGSRISVRGGGPDQNLVVMDGIEIHNPYRLHVPAEDLLMVGLASIVNPETVDTFELVPGAFDVRYGDRLSALIAVKNRDGSEAEAFQGLAFLSLTDANAMLEGKLPDRANGSWLVTARRTHFDLLERVIDARLPSFEDVQAKLSVRPRPTQRVSLLGLVGRERVSPSDTAASDERRSTNTRNNLLAVTFESGIGSKGSSRTIASFSQFADHLTASERSFDNSRGANAADSISNGGLLEFQLARTVAVRDLALRQEFVFRPSARHWLDVGFEGHGLDTRWSWTISGDRSQHQPNGSSIRLGASLPDDLDSLVDSFRLGAWMQDRLQVSSRFVLQPGLRVDRSSLTAESTVSPRLSGVLSLGRRTRLHTALRLHSQSPGYEKLFQSDYFVDLSVGRQRNLTAERALHAVAGLQQEFSGGLSARVDVYYKRFSDLIVGRLETEAERQERLARFDVPAALWPSVPTRAEITTSPANAATGRAHGVDLYLARAGGGSAPLTGWAAYSFGRARRTAYGMTRPFDYDRRHAVSVAANVKVGPRFDLSVTGRWATGFPRTPVRGVRLALVTDVGDVDGDGNREERVPQRDALGNPLFQPDLGDLSNLNAGRLPHFARVDARLTYRPSWGGERWTLYADLLNILNAKNFIQIDSPLILDPASDRPGIVEVSQDRGIPFFPSFGVRFWF